jgi:hypothetical protein
MSERRPTTEAEVTELVRSIDVRAPDSLHRRVQEMVADRERSRRARGPGARRGVGGRLVLAGAIAVAVAVLAVVLVSGVGSGPAAPSLSEAAKLTLAPATSPAPPESSTHRAQLAANVDGVHFPYWEGGLGWRSTGSRVDRVHGRRIATVFYGDRAGRQIGYTIVSGPAPKVSGGTTARRDGIPYALHNERGVAVVTWLRSGHLCVVSGRGVDSATLLHLASWGARSVAA